MYDIPVIGTSCYIKDHVEAQSILWHNFTYFLGAWEG